MFETKSSKIIFVAFLFFLLNILSFYFIQKLEDNKKSYYLNVQSELLEAKYNTSYKYLKIMSSDIVQMYLKNKKLINLFAQAKDSDTQIKNQIRNTMYASLIKNYRRLHKMGISQVHFHLPNNTSFLRMTNFKNHSDDLTKTRESVVAVNRTKQPQEGFEVCRFMSGVRFVYPIFTQYNTHIGSVEISFSSDKLLKSLEDDFVYDSHILVSKSILAHIHLDDDTHNNYIKAWEIPGFYKDENAHKSIEELNLYDGLRKQLINDIHLYKDITKGVSTKKPFTVSTLYNYQNMLLSYLPLSNGNGIENASYVVTYTESDYLSNLKIETNYTKLISFIVLTLLTLFSIYVIFSQEKLKILALYDILTKLPNRALFNINLQNEINRANRYKTSVALLFLDLDGFKQVNDTCGHTVGDKLLVRTAKKLNDKIRLNDFASRLGGDEFTVLLTDIQSPDTAVKIAKKIIEEISSELIIENNSINVGVSIGIALYPNDTTDSETLIKYADAMMYKSKENGKNQVTLYNKENKI